MSIKLLAKIKLPYYIRLNYPEEVKTELPIDDDFSYFKIVFYPNLNDSDNNNYSALYSEELCNTIDIEAVIIKYNHTDYGVEKSPVYDTYNVNDNDRKEIFKLVRDKLNHFLLYISKVTKMFWIEELPINPISDVIGTRTDFIFIHPDKELTMGSRIWHSIQDNFMVDLYSNGLKPINQKVVDEYKDKYIIHFTWNTYLNKANIALYKSEYEELIIYCAIAAESFIKQFVNSNIFSPLDIEEDIVLNKLISIGRNNMVEVYYKVILKYLFGVNLLETNEELYKNLKDIFSLRNDIMHKGFMDKDSFKKVGINELDFEQARLYLHRLNLAISTCLEIPFKNKEYSMNPLDRE